MAKPYSLTIVTKFKFLIFVWRFRNVEFGFPMRSIKFSTLLMVFLRRMTSEVTFTIDLGSPKIFMHAR